METMNSVSAIKACLEGEYDGFKGRKRRVEVAYGNLWIKGEAYNETERGFDFVPDNVTRPVRFISKLWDDTFRPEAL